LLIESHLAFPFYSIINNQQLFISVLVGEVRGVRYFSFVTVTSS